MPCPSSVVHPSSLTFHIFDFSSETTERNLKKLYRKLDLKVIYQVCVFWVDRKNKMAALASDWLRHFQLLLWNRWTEFNETWQTARSQRPLPSLCVFGRCKKQDCHPGLWLPETFSTSPLKPLNGIKRNLTRSKISTSSTKYVFFGSNGRKNKMAALAADCLRHFDFSSETTEGNSTKLDRKQDLNVLYQVRVIQADWKNKMAARASDRLRHFGLLLWKRWTACNETWQEERSQCPLSLPSLCFLGRSVKQDCRTGQSVKKVAHCTQVHDMRPFGPLVHSVILYVVWGLWNVAILRNEIMWQWFIVAHYIGWLNVLYYTLQSSLQSSYQG